MRKDYGSIEIRSDRRYRSASAPHASDVLCAADEPDEKNSPWLLLSFGTLGASTSIGFTSISLGLHYFQSLYGRYVLTMMAFSTSAASFCVMGFLLGSTILKSHMITPKRVVAALSFSALVNAAVCTTLALLVGLRVSISKPLFAALVATNGACTGLSQAMGANLAGTMETTMPIVARGVGATLLSGVSLGVLVPTGINGARLASLGVLGASDAVEAARVTTWICLAAAVVLAVTAVVALHRMVTRSRPYQVLQSRVEECLACAPEVEYANKFVAAVFRGDNARLRFVILNERIRPILPIAGALMVVEALLVLMLLLAPVIPTVGGGFWPPAFLPTVLLAISNVGQFAGKSLATWLNVYRRGGGYLQQTKENPRSRRGSIPLSEIGRTREYDHSPFAGTIISTSGAGSAKRADERPPSKARPISRGAKLGLLVAASLLGPLVAIVYARSGGSSPLTILPSSDIWAVVLFFVASALAGFTTVKIGEFSNETCGHSIQVPCPIVAQCVWLAISSGAIIATLVSKPIIGLVVRGVD